MPKEKEIDIVPINEETKPKTPRAPKTPKKEKVKTPRKLFASPHQ